MDWSSLGLEFDTFGLGMTHMAEHEPEPPCDRCGGTGWRGRMVCACVMFVVPAPRPE